MSSETPRKQSNIECWLSFDITINVRYELKQNRRANIECWLKFDLTLHADCILWE